jgi:hypothetical protein
MVEPQSGFIKLKYDKYQEKNFGLCLKAQPLSIIILIINILLSLTDMPSRGLNNSQFSILNSPKSLATHAHVVVYPLV